MQSWVSNPWHIIRRQSETCNNQVVDPRCPTCYDKKVQIAEDIMPVRLDTTAKTGTITNALSTGFSELQSLRDELMEWKDNIEEKFGQTDKFERVSECADALDEIADCEDECVPPVHTEDTVDWVEQKKKSKKSPYPRWLRLQNAVNALEAVKATLETLVEVDDDEDENPEDETRMEIQACIDKLDEIIDAANSVEFPGMFG